MSRRRKGAPKPLDLTGTKPKEKPTVHQPPRFKRLPRFGKDEGEQFPRGAP